MSYFLTGITAMQRNCLTMTNYNFSQFVTKNPEFNKLQGIGCEFIYDPDYDEENYLMYDESTDTFTPTAERSVVDAIRMDNIEDEHIFEALSNLKNLQILMEVAEFYGLGDKVITLLSCLDEWIEEFHQHH